MLPGYDDLPQKVERAIALLRQHESKALELSPDGYHLAFSGGKDSCVIKELARMAGVVFEARYNQTTIDPPELVRFIKLHHLDVQWDRPGRNFFKAMAESNGLPARLIRWCCEEYKERHGANRIKVFGVRAAESHNRKKAWKEITPWRNSTQKGYAVCPIVAWSDENVWRFIYERRLPFCDLYNEGWKRLGCVGCPMAGGGRRAEFLRWPGFEKAWRTGCRKYFDRRKGRLNRYGKPYYLERFANSDEMFDWWMSDNPTPADIKNEENECLGLFDAMDGTED